MLGNVYPYLGNMSNVDKLIVQPGWNHLDNLEKWCLNQCSSNKKWWVLDLKFLFSLKIFYILLWHGQDTYIYLDLYYYTYVWCQWLRYDSPNTPCTHSQVPRFFSSKFSPWTSHSRSCLRSERPTVPCVMKRFHGNAAMSVTLVVEDQSDSSDPMESLLEPLA